VASVISILVGALVLAIRFRSTSWLRWGGKLLGLLVVFVPITMPLWSWKSQEKDRLEPLVELRNVSGYPPLDLTVDEQRDSPRYRGVAGDGLVNPLRPLGNDWSKTSPKFLWTRPCGGGFASFAVAVDVGIMLEQRGDSEAVVCYNRASGLEQWVYSYPGRVVRDLIGAGPCATPTIHMGRVYSFGARGELVCLDGKTGAKIWQRNAVADSMARVAPWGMSSSPLIVEEQGLVIVNPGIDADNNAGKALAGYRLTDGELVWARGNHAAGYSSPRLVELARERRPPG
jgi:outer membrane protein assembly factor BamB